MIILLLLTLLQIPGTVTLAWDPNTESTLAGYKVYWGLASRQYSSTQIAAVAEAPTYVVQNLEMGKVYYFAVTAYDVNGNESDFSNEVSVVVTPDGNLSPPILSIGTVAQLGGITNEETHLVRDDSFHVTSCGSDCY